MSERSITLSGVAVTGAAVAAVLLVLYIVRKGGIGNAAAAAGAAIGGAAAQAVGGAVTGVLDTASGAIGIPGPSDTVTDPRVARWVIDNYGFMAATKWAGAPALFGALALQSGTGIPPAEGTPAYNAMPKARVITIDTGGSVGWW